MATTPQNWMEEIEDSLLLSQITIPGTHDTCALYGGDLPTCQTLSITDQLKSGIRALDIRCRHFQNKFPIHHEQFYQNIDFADVQASCINFLNANLSETIIMHIKEEYDAAENNETFESTFIEYIFPYGEFWVLNNSIPTLSSVRGKIVLLRRFELNVPNAVLGIDATPWLDNSTFAINNNGVGLLIQDQYDVPTIFDIGHKWVLILDTINRAVTDKENLLFINFTSGASGGAYPNAIAKGFAGEDGINRRLFSYLVQEPQIRNCGVIYLNFPEFPGLDFLPLIYKLNPVKIYKEVITFPHIKPTLKPPDHHM